MILMEQYYPLPLADYYNNNGFSYDLEQQIGNFTTFGSSYPGDEIPDQKDLIIEDIPFLFPEAKSTFNNIELENQRLSVPEHHYTAMFILGAADNGSYDENVEYHLNDTLVHQMPLALTNWTDQMPKYNEKVVYRCSGIYTQKGSLLTSKQTTIWLQTIQFEHPIHINAIVLPDNPCMHLFAITLKKENTNEHATTI